MGLCWLIVQGNYCHSRVVKELEVLEAQVLGLLTSSSYHNPSLAYAEANLIQRIPHSCVERHISQVIPESVKLTVDTNHQLNF